MVDVSGLKGRIAEAFVEAILRRARYQVSRLGRETNVERLVKVGGDEFLPDFLVWRPGERTGADRPLYRLLTVEVKYRANLPQFLARYGEELVEKVRTQWPDLLFVFVTDNTTDGRSCFQVVDLCRYEACGVPMTVDLHKVGDLDIYKTTVEEYEGLVKQIFPVLSSHANSQVPPGGLQGEGVRQNR